uniref:IF-2 domain-containing protein n=1 Tax=Panagrellus redivivus TaxID=6233 RepID=A0A7E4VGU7_PANRE
MSAQKASDDQTVFSLQPDGWAAIQNLAAPPPGIAQVDDPNPLTAEQEAQAQATRKKHLLNVYIQGSDPDELKALIYFLHSQRIHRVHCSDLNLGSVSKLDVQKAAIMLDRSAEFACLLAFNVPVHRTVQQYADQVKVRIFKSNHIKGLEDSVIRYRDELLNKRRAETEHLATFPCSFVIDPDRIYYPCNPIIVDVKINIGSLKRGTPICVPAKNNMLIGYISLIERDRNPIYCATSGEKATIIIENIPGKKHFKLGHDFAVTNTLFSRITKESVEICDLYFRKETRKYFMLTNLMKEDFGIV